MDDTTWMTSNQENLESILSIADEFYKITNTTINKSKSELIINKTNIPSIPTTPSTTCNDLLISETEELSLLDPSDIFDSSVTPLPISSLSPSPILTSPTFSPSKEQFKFKLQIKSNNDTSL